MSIRREIIVSFLLWACAGCAVEVGSDELSTADGGVTSDAPKPEAHAPKWWKTWSSVDPSKVVAMDTNDTYNGGSVFTWLTDGTYCRGYSDKLCAAGAAAYSSPSVPSTILGMAFAKNSGKLYTWYDDATVSIGKPDNLAYYSGKKPVNVRKWGISQLVDVAISPTNGQCYYYWLNSGLLGSPVTLSRTTGLSTDVEYYSGSKQVTFNSKAPIMGISFNYDPGNVYTWYADSFHNYNVSTDSLNLTQP